jgi:hypothetical protein
VGAAGECGGRREERGVCVQHVMRRQRRDVVAEYVSLLIVGTLGQQYGLHQFGRGRWSNEMRFSAMEPSQVLHRSAGGATCSHEFPTTW